jgi:hypothetical protein
METSVFELLGVAGIAISMLAYLPQVVPKSSADCLHDGVAVLLPTGRLVLDREIDRDSFVPVLAQRRRNPGASPTRSRHLHG